MRKKYQILVFFIILSVSIHGQSYDYTENSSLGLQYSGINLKSPEAESFGKVGFSNLNEATGKANIEIPLYTINLDGLEIPIKLTYDTGGVKVNTQSSRVGLNWTLDCGGVINKRIKGQNDYHAAGSFSDASGTGFYYTTYGYLYHLFSWTNESRHPADNASRDKYPDIYQVTAPGLNTTFIHNNQGQPIEILFNNTKIKSPFTDLDFLSNPWTPSIVADKFNDFDSSDFKFKDGYDFNFKLISNNGYVYKFNNLEYSNYVMRDFRQAPYANLPAPRTYNPSTNQFTTIPSLTSVIGTRDKFSTIFLSKISTPNGNKEIEFIYFDNNTADNNQHIESLFNKDSNSKLGQINYEYDYIKEKILKKIIFDEGTIDFEYDHNRLDVRGAKILKRIIIRNKLGQFIKGVVFEQSYFNSTTGVQDFSNLRLKLDAVKFFGKDNTYLNEYRFTYNSTKLPSKFSVDQDFFGFYNGVSNLDYTNCIPKIYYKVNQGKKSYLPFPIIGYTPLSNGNKDKTTNINFAKACILESIIYPSGATENFEYELNSFVFDNEEIKGGGLRIKTQSLLDTDLSLKKKINYFYTTDNGNSSGTIGAIPNFINDINKITSFVSINQNYVNSDEVNSTPHVIYSQVKVEEIGKGFSLNNYTSYFDYPNLFPTSHHSYIGLIDLNRFDSFLNDGLLMNFYTDNSSKRGLLIKSQIFDKNNLLIKKTENEYLTNTISTFPIYECFVTYNSDPRYNVSGSGVVFESKINIEKNLLAKSKVSEFFQGNLISKEFNYEYDSFSFQKSKDKVYTTGLEIIETNYSYPNNLISEPFANELISKNMVSTPLKKEVFKNGVKISEEKVIFDNSSSTNNFILPKYIHHKKGDNSNISFENLVTYDLYDDKGNLIQYTPQGGTPISVIWGYNKTLPIAKIENATYSQVQSQATTLQGITNNSNDVNSLITAFNSLRTSLPNAIVTSYIHQPLIGITTIIDKNGKKSTFEYDRFNRLINSKDNEANLIASNAYTFEKIPVNTAMFQLPLSVEIKKSSPYGYTPLPSSPNHSVLLNGVASGGNGAYTYEWRLNATSPVLSTSSNYLATIPCATNTSYLLKVTDASNTSIIKTVTVNAPACNEAFYASTILGTSAVSNPNNFYVNAEGGTYNYSYKWWSIRNGIITQLGTYYTNFYPKGFINNTSSSYTITLFVEITDRNSGYKVQRSRVVIVNPQFNGPSCFIAGTKILMSDGQTKNIEEVQLGDKVQTYNTENESVETGIVEEIVTPIHDKLIEIVFDNTIKNTNTLDHPYYVKNKGWCSFDPKLTKYNYGLKVKKLKVNDEIIFLDQKDNTFNTRIKISKIEVVIKEQKTYNLQKVSKNHNFFANGVLVHNKSKL